MQQQFNSYTFDSQLSLLKKDGINVKGMRFKNNDKCLELIEKRRVGIVALIVDECQVPKGSDNGLISKIIKNYSKHPYFKKCKMKKNKNRSNNTEFIIKHFVEPVTYSFKGCLATNQDKTPLIYTDLIKTSKLPLISILYTNKNKKQKSTKTVSQQFKQQLISLMKTMNATHPHYIRCLKPNKNKKSGLFNSKKTLIQLRASGIFEVVRVRKESYSYYLNNKKFLEKYIIILGDERKRSSVKSLSH